MFSLIEYRVMRLGEKAREKYCLENCNRFFLDILKARYPGNCAIEIYHIFVRNRALQNNLLASLL